MEFWEKKSLSSVNGDPELVFEIINSRSNHKMYKNYTVFNCLCDTENVTAKQAGLLL
jgi:hypothetical protein